ncbi:MAG TPA: PASTA domain-containing protein [Thermoleophilia bacterium]|nr:PASTA domain-containing protein [Thermoleophilia bacterium]
MSGSRRRLWIIIGVIVAVAVAVGVGVWLLGSGGVTVPDVTGKSESEATQLLESAGLKVGEVTQVADANVTVGAVVHQDPAAGATADKGAEVALGLSTGPGLTTVPDVTGMTSSAASDTLKSAGFAPVQAIQFDEKTPKDEVIAQLPAGGEQAYAGSPVGMLVSAGLPHSVSVPDVTGKSQDAATATLAEAGLEAVPVEAHDDQVAAGSVAAQDPAAGTMVTPLTQVLITVSLGSGSTSVAVPDVTGMVESAAVSAVEGAGLKAAKAQAYSATVKKGLVIGQEPAAGSKAQTGDSVGLLVSLGAPKAPVSSPTPSSAGTPNTSPSASTPPGGGIEPPPETGVPTVKVPNVVGLTSDEAVMKLKGISLQPVPLESPSETQPKGIVMEQMPAAGTSLPETYPVLLLVSAGPAAQVNPLPASE